MISGILLGQANKSPLLNKKSDYSCMDIAAFFYGSVVLKGYWFGDGIFTGFSKGPAKHVYCPDGYGVFSYR